MDIIWKTATGWASEDLPDIPTTKRDFNRKAVDENWPWRAHEGSGGGKEYPSTALPLRARRTLIERSRKDLVAEGQAAGRKQRALEIVEAFTKDSNLQAGLAEFVSLSDGQKQKAEARMAVLEYYKVWCDLWGTGCQARNRENFSIAYNDKDPKVTNVPILLIGEEQMPAKIKNRWERFYGRVLSWHYAQPFVFQRFRPTGRRMTKALSLVISPWQPSLLPPTRWNLVRQSKPSI